MYMSLKPALYHTHMFKTALGKYQTAFESSMNTEAVSVKFP